MAEKQEFASRFAKHKDELEWLFMELYPAILACWNSEEGQRSLVGARPLHLACARPFGRLKAPLGLSLLRCANASLPHGRQNRPIMQAKKNRKFPLGNSLPTLSYVDFGWVRPIQGRTLFLFYLNLPADYSSGESSASTRSIR